MILLGGSNDGEREPEQSDLTESCAPKDSTIPDHDDQAQSARLCTYPIVGIGSSAGGLEAASAFLRGLGHCQTASFVVIQHLSQKHPSMLVELLSRASSLPVYLVEEGIFPEPGAVYVTPPQVNLELTPQGFKFLPPPEEIVPKPSINIFLSSLAKVAGEHAVAIILSGTGSDGARGLKSIKEAGGMVLVQDPDDAKYNGMPSAALASGFVDTVAKAEDLADFIKNEVDGIHALNSDATEQMVLKRILNFIWLKGGADFRHYRTASLLRRIQRRLDAVGANTLADYHHYLNDNPDEVFHLINEVFISVTSFYRDPEAFKALTLALTDLIAQKNNGEELRIWVAGCATGEEAYTIAMIAQDLIYSAGNNLSLKIFASDASRKAIEKARDGKYPINDFNQLPKHLKDEYVQQLDGRGAVKDTLRNKILFAQHDVLSDVPFPRLDLISCRNLFIYLDTQGQSRVLRTFHHALSTNGLLFLGQSEGASGAIDYFSPLSSKYKLFKPTADKSSGLILPVRKPKAPSHDTGAGLTNIHEKLIAYYAPPSVLVNSQMEILNEHDDLSIFFEQDPRASRLSLNSSLLPEFRSELQFAIHRIGRGEKVARGAVHNINGKDWRLAAHALSVPSQYLICFEPCVAEEDGVQRHYVAELQNIKEGSSEFQVLSEELQSSNEELQATNEELGASNQELQATSEELTSLNQELIQKSSILSEMNVDFEAVNNVTPVCIIVLDANLVIRRLNKAACDLLSLPGTVKGQVLRQLKLSSPFDRLIEIAGEAQKSSKNIKETLIHKNNAYDVSMEHTWGGDKVLTGSVLVVSDITDLTEATNRAILVEKRLTDVMNQSSLLFSVKDMQGNYLFANEPFLEFFGVDPDGIIGKNDHALFPVALADKLRNPDFLVSGDVPKSQHEVFNAGEEQRHFQVTRFALRDETGAIYAVCMQADDITESIKAQEQLNLAAKVFHRAGEGISITDGDGKIITVNESFTKVSGYRLDEVQGKSPAILKSDKQTPQFYREMWAAIKKDGWWQGEIWNKRKNGEVYPEWLTINAVYDENKEITNYVGIFSDISIIKDSQRRIEYLATHDELTGLPNRTLFLDRISHAIERGRRDRTSLVLMFIDLDNFKTINDSMGHDIGDLLLIEAGRRLQDCIRAGDTIARLGGDEFTVLLEDSDFLEVAPVANRIIKAMAKAFPINDQNLFVSASIGMSTFPGDAEDSASLLKHADTAMYEAKGRGKNQVSMFTSEMRKYTEQRIQIESGIRQALEQDQFHLVLQPIIDLETDTIAGAEALIRWVDKEGNFISPANFIPVAEQTGLIGPITEWVCDKIFSQIQTWQNQNHHVFPISINFSSQHFQKNAAFEMLGLMAQRYGVGGGAIGVEITEGVLMDSSESVVTALHGLRSLGYNIFVDDFGTGYSSLSYLKQYPIDILKIDKSFVDGIADSSDDRSICKAIIQMAKALDLKVVAEGVETEQQAEVLKSLGCDRAQGYFYYRPLAMDKFEDLLIAKQPKSRF